MYAGHRSSMPIPGLRIPRSADGCLGAQPHGFVAGLGADLGEDRGDVMVDGLLRHEETLRDLGVGEAFAEEVEDLRLAGSQPVRVSTGLGTRSTRNRGLARLAKPPAGE